MSETMNDTTIIIKTFERPQSLMKLLVSIRRFYPSVPIMIADDSKTPSAQDITSRFSNLEYIPLRFDVGLSAGRNELLARVKSKYFVLCDDDFIFNEDTKLENFKKILDETDIELIGGYFDDITESGDFNQRRLYAGNLVLEGSRDLYMVLIEPRSPYVRCDIVPNWFMAKAQAVRTKIGGWDPRLKVEEHTDFFWRAKQAGLNVAFTPDVSVHHTVARDQNYLYYRDTRKNKYYWIFFQKFGIRSFTDIWETVTAWEVRPWLVRFMDQKCIPWFVIERWRKFYWRMDWEIKQVRQKDGKFSIRQVMSRLKSLILAQKCMPWPVIERWRKFYWRMDWEIKQAHARLRECFRQAKQSVSKAKDSSARQIRKSMQPWERWGLILMYHRVKELDCDPWQLCVTPSRFEEHMQVIKKYGRPVQMREMGKNLKHFSFGDKEIVLTFDDGYADNFYNAKPILEHYEIPATFFIVSGAVGSREEYWWDELGRIILAAAALPAVFDSTIAGTKYHFPIIPKVHKELRSYSWTADMPQNNTPLSRTQLYYVLWRILSPLSSQGKKDALRQIAQWSGQSSSPRQTHRTMTSQELVSLAHCPLFEIGAHTVCHPLLSHLTPQEQEKEIGRSKRELEDMVGRRVTSFSYPHGNYSDETLKIVERLHFKAACTTESLSVARNTSPYLLPRFEVLNWDGDQFEQKLQKWLNNEAENINDMNVTEDGSTTKGPDIPESFSEEITGNDKWVVDIFKGKKGGFFVEAGACEGTFGSNTYALELHYEWQGICVEPSDALFEQLKINRKCICVNCCLGDKKGVAQYIECQNCFSGIKDYLHVAKEEFWKDGTPKQKPLVLLHDVLREHNAPQTIDYLSLDTEGSEYAILKSFPFDQYKILALTIEGDACNDLLLSKGYVRVENPYNAGAPWEQYFVHPEMISG